MSVAVSPDGERLATGSVEKAVKIWNLKTGTSFLPDLKSAV